MSYADAISTIHSLITTLEKVKDPESREAAYTLLKKLIEKFFIDEK